MTDFWLFWTLVRVRLADVRDTETYSLRKVDYPQFPGDLNCSERSVTSKHSMPQFAVASKHNT